ncbi:hypothetical protein CDAR_465491 [Caerostris darwini]|uniref:Uncharacterized protein n=1 Tax=Caerostris darwini TaxID=1538125 RepID=A0AAV4S964_9ARAC|nr:hypothetical protein CDAR_465491 [Caerostris darwini]
MIPFIPRTCTKADSSHFNEAIEIATQEPNPETPFTKLGKGITVLFPPVSAHSRPVATYSTAVFAEVIVNGRRGSTALLNPSGGSNRFAFKSIDSQMILPIAFFL